MFSEKLNQLIKALTCLPSIGNKSAQRLAVHLIQQDPKGGQAIANALLNAIESIHSCKACRNLSDTEVCLLCRDSKRDRSTLCIVEGPMDVFAIEQSVAYKGLYFVLMGKLSPLDGVGPNEIGLDQLEVRLQTDAIKELILATNITVEGDATAHYISGIAERYHIPVTRLALGIPMGGELEHVDRQTLDHAFSKRTQM